MNFLISALTLGLQVACNDKPQLIAVIIIMNWELWTTIVIIIMNYEFWILNYSSMNSELILVFGGHEKSLETYY